MLSMQVRYFQVDRRNLAYLKFIIEAYEGMAIMSTIERKGAIVSISSPACFSEDIDQLLTAITAEIPMTESAYPGYGTVFQNGEDENA